MKDISHKLDPRLDRTTESQCPGERDIDFKESQCKSDTINNEDRTCKTDTTTPKTQEHWIKVKKSNKLIRKHYVKTKRNKKTERIGLMH